MIVINLYFRDLSENLTTDKIAEIRAKLISNRRTRIKPEDEDSKSQSLALGDMEVTTIKLYFFNLLWGSEIWTCLYLEWSQRWFANGLDLKSDLNSRSPTI